jgi:hypothetical protein
MKKNRRKIDHYTVEIDFNKILNREIGVGATKSQNERRYIIALFWYHPKLDELAYIGPCYRVLKINYNELEKYRINCSLMKKSFLSSSIDPKIAELFLCQKESALKLKLMDHQLNHEVICVYHINHRRTALDIENSSQYANEEEVLITSYTVFKVKRISQIKPSYVPKDQTITELN